MVPVAQRRAALIRYTNVICYDLTNAPQVQDACASFLSRKGNFMDEYDDKQHDRLEIQQEEAGDQTSSSPPPSSRSIEPLGLTPLENMITQSANGSGNGTPISRQPS